MMRLLSRSWPNHKMVSYDGHFLHWERYGLEVWKNIYLKVICFLQNKSPNPNPFDFPLSHCSPWCSEVPVFRLAITSLAGIGFCGTVLGVMSSSSTIMAYNRLFSIAGR